VFFGGNSFFDKWTHLIDVPLCYLKRAVPAAVHAKDIVSGVKNLIVVDRQHSSLATDANKQPQTAPLSAPPKNIKIFIDKSVVEIFVDGGKTNIVSRIYPQLSTSQGINIFATGGTVKAIVDVWQLSSIWD